MYFNLNSFEKKLIKPTKTNTIIQFIWILWRKKEKMEISTTAKTNVMNPE